MGEERPAPIPEIEALVPGYYESLLKMGSALDMDPAIMARELKVARSVLEELRQKHSVEIAKLKTSRKVADALFSDLAFVRLTKLHDTILSDLEGRISELPLSKAVELLQFLSSYLSKQDEARRGREGPADQDNPDKLPADEIKKRALRLLGEAQK